MGATGPCLFCPLLCSPTTSTVPSLQRHLVNIYWISKRQAQLELPLLSQKCSLPPLKSYPSLTPMAFTVCCLVVWLIVHVLSPQLDRECLWARDQSFHATVTLIVLSPISSIWHVHSNTLFRELIKMLAFLFLSLAMLVVTGGSYNSLMFGNTIETTFYRLELGKDIRMLSFYCKNISANLLGKAKTFL